MIRIGAIIMDIEDIANIIFTSAPKPSNTIMLDFSEYSDYNDISAEKGAEYLFNELIILFTKGMKILFGDAEGKVDLAYLTDNDFDKISRYFKSFGFIVQYDINNKRPEIVHKNKLSDYSLTIRSNTNGADYTVWFNYNIN